MELEGWLLKKGEKGPIKNWKRRYFRQQKEALVYYRTDVTQDPLGNILLTQGMDGDCVLTFYLLFLLKIYFFMKIVISVHPTHDFKDRKFAFQVNTKGRVFYLAAESEEQFHYWITGMVSYIKHAGTSDRLANEEATEKGKL